MPTFPVKLRAVTKGVGVIRSSRCPVRSRSLSKQARSPDRIVKRSGMANQPFPADDSRTHAQVSRDMMRNLVRAKSNIRRDLLRAVMFLARSGKAGRRERGVRRHTGRTIVRKLGLFSFEGQGPHSQSIARAQGPRLANRIPRSRLAR